MSAVAERIESASERAAAAQANEKMLAEAEYRQLIHSGEIDSAFRSCGLSDHAPSGSAGSSGAEGCT